MSSTNRGATRHGADYYRTPIHAIVQFLNAWRPTITPVTDILDPCAGGDDDHPMSYPEAIHAYTGLAKTTHLHVTTMDIREDSKADFCADYLAAPTWSGGKQWDIIITNPPFNLALPIIQKAITEIKDDGYVVMLLRLNFLGSKARSAWLSSHMPESIWVHSKRMSFHDSAGTDSVEYAHFVWRKHHSENTTLKLINEKL